MRKLTPETKKVWLLNGVQLFSKVDLGKMLGINRNTVQKNIEAWEVPPAAHDNKGRDLYSVQQYLIGQNRGRVDDEGSNKYGGYIDSLDWKNAIAAKRDQLRLDKDEGLLVDAWEAEQEIASCFSDVAKIGEALLTIVDTELHPDGVGMERIAGKFKMEQGKYYDRIIDDTNHVEGI